MTYLSPQLHVLASLRAWGIATIGDDSRRGSWLSPKHVQSPLRASPPAQALSLVGASALGPPPKSTASPRPGSCPIHPPPRPLLPAGAQSRPPGGSQSSASSQRAPCNRESTAARG